MNDTQRITPLAGLEALLGVPAGGKGGIREMRIKDENNVGNILVRGRDCLRRICQCRTSPNTSIMIRGIKS